MRVTQPIMRGLVLLAAILIWANVQAFAVQTTTIQLPIIPPDNLSYALDQALPNLQIQVSGRRNQIAKLNSSNLVFGVNWNDVRSNQTANLPISLLSSPVGITVIDFQPQQLSITTSPITSKLVQIKPQYTGSLTDGYRVATINLSPNQLEVSGSASLLALIDSAYIDIKLNNQTQSFNFQSTSYLPWTDPNSYLPVTLDPTTISGEVVVEAGSNSRTLGIQPNFTGDLPAGYFIKEVKFNPPVMSVTGSLSDLNQLDILQSTPINLNNKRGPFTVDTAIELPTSIATATTNLLSVTVDIQLAQSSREFVITPQFVNPTDGLSVTASTPRTINLVVVGESTVLDQLKRTDIEMNVDLQGLLTGSNTVSINAGMFKLPPGVTVGSFTPASLEVILSRL
ncbi:MAG: CdaR family protein [Patescibacteria group bacterium]